MAVDNYVSIGILLSHKTLQRITKLAQEYGISRTKTIQRLLEEALIAHGEPIERSTVTVDGEKNQYGAPVSVNNSLRKVL